mgnify:CR=1 FL=1
MIYSLFYLFNFNRIFVILIRLVLQNQRFKIALISARSFAK